MAQYELFEYEGEDPSMPENMNGWVEVFDADEENAWIASDTSMEVQR